MDPLTQAPTVQANPLAQQFPALAPQNGQAGTADPAQLLAQIQALMGNNLQGPQGQGLGQNGLNNITAINPAAIQNAGPVTGNNLSGFPTLRQLQGLGGAPQGLPQGLPQGAAAPANNGDSTNKMLMALLQQLIQALTGQNNNNQDNVAAEDNTQFVQAPATEGVRPRANEAAPVVQNRENNDAVRNNAAQNEKKPVEKQAPKIA